MDNPYLPREVEVIERIQESPDTFTLRLRFTDPSQHASYRYAPGQFNMLYLYGVGEVPISIVSDIEDVHMLDHTIRAVGRVTKALATLKTGARLGIRGPLGQGWPLRQAQGQDVLIVTGGLGCAPSVSVIRHILRRRGQFGNLTILQGVKHSNDLIWRDQYTTWAKQPDTQVLLAADVTTADWIGQQGLVTTLLDDVNLAATRTIVMLCGPEPMMIATIERLLADGIPPTQIWLSMERNMQCGVGHCGHCQIGPLFVCRDGPVFNYPTVAPLLGVRGF